MGKGMIELHNIDCMDYMRSLPDNAFDLAIVDPPYGIGASQPRGSYARAALGYTAANDKRWDTAPPPASYFIELRRVAVHQIIWGANYMTPNIPPSSSWVCWYKTDELKGRDFSEFELAYTSLGGRARHFEYRPFIRNGGRIHPTQKPVALYKWLLSNYAKPGQRILDTHLGSGSIAIACHDMGFDLVGCELDADYYNGACKRLAQHQSQTRLVL